MKHHRFRLLLPLVRSASAVADSFGAHWQGVLEPLDPDGVRLVNRLPVLAPPGWCSE